MTGSCEAFLRQTVRTAPDLFGRIVQFNFRPARYLHGRRIGSLMDAGLFQRLAAHPAGEKLLSERIAAHWGLDAAGFFDFEQSRRRLALLAPQTLDRLFRLSGLALAGRAISQQVRRAEVLAFRRAFSADDCRFALKRASMLVGAAGQSLAEPQRSGETLAECVQSHRRKMIACCFAGEPSALTSRVWLKLAPEDEPRGDEAVTAEQREAAWRIVRKIALTERLDGEGLCFK